MSILFYRPGRSFYVGYDPHEWTPTPVQRELARRHAGLYDGLRWPLVKLSRAYDMAPSNVRSLMRDVRTQVQRRGLPPTPASWRRVLSSSAFSLTTTRLKLTGTGSINSPSRTPARKGGLSYGK